MREFCHGIAPCPQPSPARNPGGDCFACALTAVMAHLFPEDPPAFDRVWEWFKTNYLGETEKRALCNTWHGMGNAISEAHRDGYDVEHLVDGIVPLPDFARSPAPFGMEINEQDYAYRLEGWLRSGWLALTEIEQHPTGKGPWRSDGYRRSVNHFVVIDGVRYGWEYEGEAGSRFGSMRFYARVVCSASGAYWIRVSDLLASHGAAAWRLVRRDTR